ncbi:MAG: hypothetical protein EHM64_17290, partial [Ignavibacteriae bacterium]
MCSRWMFILCSMVIVLPVHGQTSDETKIKLAAVAQSVLSSGIFQLKEERKEPAVNSYVNVPLKKLKHLVSPYNDWRYWNGVLNIAMMDLGRVMENSAYVDFAKRNIAFGFEVAPEFEKDYNGEGKWNYPFGQFFLMEELDDCGAMGASVIEAYRISPTPSYKT